MYNQLEKSVRNTQNARYEVPSVFVSESHWVNGL